MIGEVNKQTKLVGRDEVVAVTGVVIASRLHGCQSKEQWPAWEKGGGQFHGKLWSVHCLKSVFIIS